jgi:MoaA/NifB/PqqE/SkfB family radical SAM enzyme
VDLRLPNLYPDAKERKCPYIERSTMVVRCDGLVVPCTEYMHSQSMHVNAHLKKVHELIFGDLTRQKVEDFWMKADYINFRPFRENMAMNIPWCGYCPYSSLGCYYTKTNELDCYGNIYTCNECLHSVNLAKCKFKAFIQ